MYFLAVSRFLGVPYLASTEIASPKYVCDRITAMIRHSGTQRANTFWAGGVRDLAVSCNKCLFSGESSHELCLSQNADVAHKQFRLEERTVLLFINRSHAEFSRHESEETPHVLFGLLLRCGVNDVAAPFCLMRHE